MGGQSGIVGQEASLRISDWVVSAFSLLDLPLLCPAAGLSHPVSIIYNLDTPLVQLLSRAALVYGQTGQWTGSANATWYGDNWALGLLRS